MRGCPHKHTATAKLGGGLTDTMSHYTAAAFASVPTKFCAFFLSLSVDILASEMEEKKRTRMCTPNIHTPNAFVHGMSQTAAQKDDMKTKRSSSRTSALWHREAQSSSCSVCVCSRHRFYCHCATRAEQSDECRLRVVELFVVVAVVVGSRIVIIVMRCNCRTGRQTPHLPNQTDTDYS